MNEQVIQVDGRFCRVIPSRKCSEEDAAKCPEVTVCYADGYYQKVPEFHEGSFKARDISSIWDPSING